MYGLLFLVGQGYQVLALGIIVSIALSKAEPFTEKVKKGSSTLYRARFSGFDENDAQVACKTLQKTGFSCFAARGG